MRTRSLRGFDPWVIVGGCRLQVTSCKLQVERAVPASASRLELNHPPVATGGTLEGGVGRAVLGWN